VPFGQHLVITNVEPGFYCGLRYLAFSRLALMAGTHQQQIFTLGGGLRAAAQSISYEIPLALSVLAVVMMSNSLSSIDIVEQQSGWHLGWNIWRQPIGFIIFWIAT